MKMKHTFNPAFTIVELIIVIVVLGILAGLVTMGFGNWQESVAKKAVQSDLQMAASAMENAKNFGEGYPELSQGDTPPGFKGSEHVTVTYYAGNSSSYCIDAVSTTNLSVYYFLDSSSGKTPLRGTCAGGEEIPGAWSATSNTCALRDSKAYCWGPNHEGQLGNSSWTNSNVPVAVSASGVLSGKTVRSISRGMAHACVVASDNKAYCWGRNASGQLGNGSTTNSNVPVAVSTSGVLSGKTIKSISAGGSHTCAVASDDNAYCWGKNNLGELGNGSTTNSNVPVAVSRSGALAGKTVKSISVSKVNEGSTAEGHTCIVASDNNAYCWGYGANGRLGNGSTTNSNVPVAVSTSGVLSGKTIKSISAGGSHTCAVASDDNAYCWGNSWIGKLGDGTTSDSSIPVAVTKTGALSGKTVKVLSAAEGHTCIVASDNNAYCWGWNTYGQLGNGSTASSNVPVAVSTSGVLSGKTIKSISLVTDHACVTASDGNMYCWGSGWSGKLGHGSTSDSGVPVQVTNP